MKHLLTDLAERWHRARRAALGGTPKNLDCDELDLLRAALDADPDTAIRTAFSNSLRLGRGFARTFGRRLRFEELPAVLPQLGVPCLRGEYFPDTGEPGLRLVRAGCPFESLGHGGCDFFREAISGLVLGLTETTLHTRHESIGHGSAGCTDAFYVHFQSPLRYGPIPDDMQQKLERALRLVHAFDSSARVTFLGFSENVLTYVMDTPAGPGMLSVHSLIERAVRRLLPDIHLLEVSPRAVMGADA